MVYFNTQLVGTVKITTSHCHNTLALQDGDGNYRIYYDIIVTLCITLLNLRLPMLVHIVIRQI